jgi:short-chain 2-methylacyl-CoA dehydrogenase
MPKKQKNKNKTKKLKMLLSRMLISRAPLAVRRTLSCSASLSSNVREGVSVLSEEEEMLREMVRKFAQDELEPRVQRMDEAQAMDSEVIDACFSNGLMGLDVPEEFGGGGASFFGAILTIEELAKVDPSVSVMVDVQNTLFNNAILNWGTEAQRQEFLPRLASNTLASFCLSEWSCGSDAFALKTRAVADGPDHFVLNGTKAWITNAGEAKLFLVFANVDPPLGHRGITAFLVDATQNDGLRVGKKEEKLGIRSSSTCEVNLVDCRVHCDAIVGEIGKGYQIAIGTLNEGRIGIAGQMLGIAQGALDKTMPYLAQREAFGQRIIDFQAMQHEFARCEIDIETARLLVYNAARLKIAKRPFIKEAAMAKLHASEVAERVSSSCIKMLGGVGYTREFGVEHFLRSSMIGQIYEGTSFTQLNTIAKLIAQERGLQK